MRKRTISIIVLCLSIVWLLTMLAGCPNTDNIPTENNKNRVALTLDNYENYISIKCTFGGDPSTMHWNSLNSEYRYNAVKSEVAITSVASYLKFDNCIIKVKINGEYYYTASSKLTYSYDHTVNLSIGGTGASSNSYKQSNCHKIKGIGYQVLSVSGYVIVE